MAIALCVCVCARGLVAMCVSPLKHVGVFFRALRSGFRYYPSTSAIWELTVTPFGASVDTRGLAGLPSAPPRLPVMTSSEAAPTAQRKGSAVPESRFFKSRRRSSLKKPRAFCPQLAFLKASKHVCFNAIIQPRSICRIMVFPRRIFQLMIILLPEVI